VRPVGDYLHLRRPTIWIHSSGEEASVWVGGGLPRFSRPVPLVAYHISTRLTHPNGRWLHRLSRAQDGDVQGLLLGVITADKGNLTGRKLPAIYLLLRASVNKGASALRPAGPFGSSSSRYCSAPFRYFSCSFPPRLGSHALRPCLRPRAGRNSLDLGHWRPQLAQVVLSQVALNQEESHAEYLLF
jgi:hypothetical protein